MSTQPRVLGTFTLAMITMAAIVSLRNLSITAALGYSSVFFLCFAALVFFIPTALVVAELAAGWPRAGGCYVWVGEAFGKPLAFFTLWLSWMASVAWFPAILVFTASMLAHMLSPWFPNLEYNTTFMLLSMLTIFWGTTLINFVGIELSGILSAAGVVIGTLVPGALIIMFGVWWVINGHPTDVPLSVNALIPDFKLDNLTLFAGVILSLAGVEIAAYHIRETKDPKHSYPRAIIFASILILLVYILGTLAIAVVVPQANLSLASGLMQAFIVFFNKMGWPLFAPVLAAFLFVGALAGINAWVVGPAKGMLVVAQDGFFPKWLRKVNQHGVPTALLTMQAVVGSILSLVFLYIRNSNTSIWLLTSLSAQFTCVVYVMIFCAALKLRYSQASVARPFKVVGMWCWSLTGILACLFSFLIVYVPHADLVDLDCLEYLLILAGIFVLLSLPTLLLIKYRQWSS
jgi:amino acid transporter